MNFLGHFSKANNSFETIQVIVFLLKRFFFNNFLFNQLNAIMNDTRFWYCDICCKTMNFSSRLRYINSNSHFHKKQYDTVVREYEYIQQKIDEMSYVLNDTVKIKDFKTIYFQSFEYRIVLDLVN